MPQRQAVANDLDATCIADLNVDVHVGDAEASRQTRANARSKGSARVGSMTDLAQAARWFPRASRLRRQLPGRGPSGKGRRKRRSTRTRKRGRKSSAAACEPSPARLVHQVVASKFDGAFDFARAKARGPMLYLKSWYPTPCRSWRPPSA